MAELPEEEIANTKPDTYDDAVALAVGRMWGNMMQGAIAAGMSRREALVVVQTWVEASMSQPRSQE